MEEVLELPEQIVLPEDKDLRQKLEQKKEEYYNRLNPFDHPQVQLLEAPDAFLKHRILSELLNEGQVDGSNFITKLMEEFPSPPCLYRAETNLNNAWGVINDYCTNHGKNTIRADGKTGFGEEKEKP